jgi:hypothetical protein
MVTESSLPGSKSLRFTPLLLLLLSSSLFIIIIINESRCNRAESVDSVKFYGQPVYGFAQR